MRVIIFLITALIVVGCSDDDEPGFDSLIGTWSYATPDGKIAVEFDIAGGSTAILEIQNPKIFVDGAEGKAAALANDVEETSIGSLRINANDATLVYPFDIVFVGLAASPDFKTIEVESATYTWPWSSASGPTSNSLTAIQIVRK